MSQWLIKGLRTGIKSTPYPRATETAAGTSPGLPAATRLAAEQAQSVVARCPTGALELAPAGVDVNVRQCIHCMRCAREYGQTDGLGTRLRVGERSLAVDDRTRHFGPAFARSVQILVVDTGDCGACLNEVRQVNNPYYNLHRLGFFLTPTPRHADVLLVVGALTEHMRAPLLKAYNAMPGPKRIVAVGACALSGGIFGRSFMCAGGVSELLPVDVEVPGNPPPPLAILHGLLVAVGRKTSASLHRAVGGSTGKASG